MSDTRPFDPVLFGQRLKKELERAGLDIKAFQIALAKRVPGRGKGTSYGQVWSYVNGQAPRDPRRELVEAMAQELRVLPSYLLEGGPRTEQERQAQEAAKEQDPVGFLEERISQVWPEYPHLSGDARILVVMALERFYDAAPASWFRSDGELSDPDDLNRFLLTMRLFVHGPLLCWSESPDLSDPPIHDYVRSALSAFIHSIPSQLPQKPSFAFFTTITED